MSTPPCAFDPQQGGLGCRPRLIQARGDGLRCLRRSLGSPIPGQKLIEPPGFHRVTHDWPEPFDVNQGAELPFALP